MNHFFELFFCFGLAILAVALLILMSTRWGQARPLSKCIALSVFAHVLLITYAYGTKLIFDYPEEKPESFIHLAVLREDIDESPAGEFPTSSQPWNEYGSESVVPEVRVPSRQPLDTELADDSPPADHQVHDFSPAVRPAELPSAEPTRPTATPTVTVPEPSVAAPSRAEMEPVPRQNTPDPEADALVPVANAPPRQSVEDLPLEVTPVDAGQQPRAPAVQALMDRAGGIQQLTDIPRAELPAARPGDGAPLPELYAHRSAGSRGQSLQRFGGSQQTEEAVTAALKWLAAVQSPNGNWDADHLGAGRETRVLGHNRRGAGSDADAGITGLALLALMGAGHTHYEGEHRESVQRGLEYLLRIQADDGDLAGNARLFARMYCHGIASLALSEAFALSGDQRLEPYVRRAIEYSIRSQHPTTGGWRYQPGDLGDTSQFGWQVMAIKSARLAGIETPAETRAGMLRFLSSVSSGQDGGLASYRRGERVSTAMTAEALLCRYFLGQHHNAAAIDEATQYVLTALPNDGKANLYYWYYGTLALFQVQGTAWQRWNGALQRQLLSRQITRGPHAGSWAPDTVWGGYGGRVYSTAMAALCLEVYYRYLPVYETAQR